MIKSAILAAISAAALASGGMAYAQTPAAKATSAVKTTATKRVTAAKTTVTTPAKATATKTTTAVKTAAVTTTAKPAATWHKAAAAPTGRIVTATTKTGKTVHYDCSKAGNANKKACK